MIYPQSKPDTWMEYWQLVQEKSMEYVHTLRNTFIDLLNVYIIPALYMAVELFKVAFQILVDNFHRHLVPTVVYVVEQLKIYSAISGRILYEYTIIICDYCTHTGADVFKSLKYYAVVISSSCVQMIKNMWNQISTWTLFVYNYFSLFPLYKLFCLAIILVLIFCCLAMLIYTCKKHKQATKKFKTVSFKDKNSKSMTSVESDDDFSRSSGTGDCTKGIIAFLRAQRIRSQLISSKKGIYIK